MKITAEQRASWAERTAQSPFNLWLADKTRGSDGRLDLEKLHALAEEYEIGKRVEYEAPNPGQQRMNIGNALRARVPASLYASYEAVEGDPQIFGTWFWGFDRLCTRSRGSRMGAAATRS